jgi:hypothetical protein
MCVCGLGVAKSGVGQDVARAKFVKRFGYQPSWIVDAGTCWIMGDLPGDVQQEQQDVDQEQEQQEQDAGREQLRLF